MDPMITTGITSENVVRVIFSYLRETESIDVHDVEDLTELLGRDISYVV
jgi:hypothetical protein